MLGLVLLFRLIGGFYSTLGVATSLVPDQISFCSNVLNDISDIFPLLISIMYLPKNGFESEFDIIQHMFLLRQASATWSRGQREYDGQSLRTVPMESHLSLSLSILLSFSLPVHACACAKDTFHNCHSLGQSLAIFPSTYMHHVVLQSRTYDINETTLNVRMHQKCLA